MYKITSAICFALILSASVPASADLVNVPMTADAANSTPSSNSGSLAGTLNDPFSYDPNNPTSTLPDQTYSSNGDGFHANVSNGGDAVLWYTLSEITFATDDLFVFDFYGRDQNIQRDDDFDVSLFTGGVDGTLVASVLANMNPDTLPFFSRVDFSSVLNDGDTFDAIRIVGHNTTIGSNSNFFTVMEVRAAAGTAVPEPSITMLALVTLLGVVACSRRKSQVVRLF